MSALQEGAGGLVPNSLWDLEGISGLYHGLEGWFGFLGWLSSVRDLKRFVLDHSSQDKFGSLAFTVSKTWLEGTCDVCSGAPVWSC